MNKGEKEPQQIILERKVWELKTRIVDLGLSGVITDVVNLDYEGKEPLIKQLKDVLDEFETLRNKARTEVEVILTKIRKS